MASKLVGYLVLTLTYRKEGNRWTAHCDELGTATYARTLSLARKRLEEAVVCHLNTLEDVGERERFFKEHNLTFRSHKPRSTTLKVHTAGLDKQTFVQPYVQVVRETVTA